jgi:hypothetical protein
MLSDSSTAYDRLVDVNFAISNLYVVFTLWVCAYPSLVVNSSTLSSEVGQGDQSTFITIYALRPVVGFRHCCLLGSFGRCYTYEQYWLNANNKYLCLFHQSKLDHD